MSETRGQVRAPDGTRLATYEWGRADGLEVLLIHGFAQSHLCFAPQYTSTLAEHCRLVAFDMRGHGESEQPTNPAAYQGSRAWADDIAAVIEAKDLKRPVLVGWSMGGRVTRQYLMVHGDARLAGINFVASQVIEEPRNRGPGAPKPLPEGTPLEAEIDDAIASLDGCFGKKPSEAEFRKALGYNMHVPAAIRRAILGWATPPGSTTEALRKVRMPVLITHGRRDTVLPFERMERFQARLKAFGLNVTWLPFDGDHGIPDEVMEGMNAFIRTIFQRDTPF